MSFNKVGDSTLTKVMTIKNGKAEGVKIAKCLKCGQVMEECTCPITHVLSTDAEVTKDVNESKGQD